MHLARDNLFARVLRADDKEREWLRVTLRHETKGKASRFGAQPLEVFDAIHDQFPAGLLPDLAGFSARDAMPFTLTDEREAKPLPACDLNDLEGWLDALQVEALRVACERGRGILQLATGGGKTELALAIMGRLFPTARCLFLAPRTILATQARDRWALRASQGHLPDEPLGLLAEGAKSIARVTFGTFQTLHAAMNNPNVERLLQSVAVLIADECHTSPADTFYPILMATPRARLRFGLSASALQRGDERSALTVGALGPIIHTVTARELIASGRIVDAEVVMHECHQMALRSHPRDLAPDNACTACNALGDEPCADDCPTMDPRTGLFRRIYAELVVQSTPRNALIRELALVEGSKGLVFFRDLEHGKNLSTLLSRAGMRLRVVTGAKSEKQRKNAIKELQRDEIDVILASTVFEAGVDIPELRWVLNAGAGLSTIRTVQILGRVVRAAEGKQGARMLDILDTGEPSLTRHAHQRRRAYKAEGFEVTVCPTPTSTPRPAT